MLETKATLLKNELSELSDALMGRNKEADDGALDADWLPRASQLGSQIAPLFRA